jgi:hypothetical protein
MKPWQLLLIAPLMVALGACDLDKARGSGATKHHADRHDKNKSNDDKEWDDAMNQPEEPENMCEGPWPPVCPGNTMPTACSPPGTFACGPGTRCNENPPPPGLYCPPT